MKIARLLCGVIKCLTLFLFLQLTIYPQINFEILYGGSSDERGTVVELTSDGGYVIGGSTNSFGSGDLDFYLIKINNTGDLEWSRTYSTYNDERIHGVKQAQNGDYYISGWMKGGFGWYDILVMKIDSDGNQIWVNNFGGYNPDEPRGLSITEDGGVIVSGYVASFGFGAKDIQLIKLDSNGSTEWARTFGTIYQDHNSHNIIGSDGNYIFSGMTDFTGYLNWNPTLIKTDPLGNIIWAKRFPGSVEDWARSLTELSTGGYVIVGNSKTYGAGQNDIYIIKTDTSGNVLWAKAIGGYQEDVGYAVTETSDSNIAVAGYTNSFGFGGYDAFLLKIGLDGNLQWFHNFGGLSDEYAFDMKKANDDGFILTGRRYSDSFGASDVYLIKTDAQGNTPCGFFNASPIVTDVTLNAVNVNFGIASGIPYSNPSYTMTNQHTEKNVLCRVIPVELGSFNSKVNDDNNVVLTWETITETNNFGFEIQRENNAIGFTKGMGTTTEKHSYSFIDKYVVPGKYEYKVIQIDFDGTRKDLFMTMVDVNSAPVSFLLSQNYPNPFNPSTKISYSIPRTGYVSLKVFNSLGIEVRTLLSEEKTPGVYTVEFNAGNLPSGIYFYTIRADNFVSTKKMILLK